MHEIIIDGLPPEGRLELPSSGGMRIEALPGESFEIRMNGSGVEALDVVQGDATVSERRITFGTVPGQVSVNIYPKDDSGARTLRFMLTEPAAFDHIPRRHGNGAGDALTASEKRLVLRSMSQPGNAPWFNGTLASMAGHSLSEFGA